MHAKCFLLWTNPNHFTLEFVLFGLSIQTKDHIYLHLPLFCSWMLPRTMGTLEGWHWNEINKEGIHCLGSMEMLEKYKDTSFLLLHNGPLTSFIVHFVPDCRWVSSTTEPQDSLSSSLKRQKRQARKVGVSCYSWNMQLHSQKCQEESSFPNQKKVQSHFPAAMNNA